MKHINPVHWPHFDAPHMQDFISTIITMNIFTAQFALLSSLPIMSRTVVCTLFCRNYLCRDCQAWQPFGITSQSLFSRKKKYKKKRPHLLMRYILQTWFPFQFQHSIVTDCRHLICIYRACPVLLITRVVSVHAPLAPTALPRSSVFRWTCTPNF